MESSMSPPQILIPVTKKIAKNVEMKSRKGFWKTEIWSRTVYITLNDVANHCHPDFAAYVRRHWHAMSLTAWIVEIQRVLFYRRTQGRNLVNNFRVGWFILLDGSEVTSRPWPPVLTTMRGLSPAAARSP